MRPLVYYLPLATTALALLFGSAVWRRWRERGAPHLLWWSIGLFTYAAGAATEAAITLVGWHGVLFRAWYITGALLGGAPLAQGTAYLLLSRRAATRWALAMIAVVVAGAICVTISPIDASLVEPFRPSGRVLAWHWVRLFSPFVNLYALIFLVGGAAVSAARYARKSDAARRCAGNVLIAVGGLLPGIGGTATRFGHTEVLYVTELLGLLLIFAGYRANVTAAVPAMHRAAAPAAAA